MTTRKPLALMLCSLLLGTGCSSTPQWDARFGDSLRQARAQQTIDPDAANRAAAANGVDGKAAVGALKTYAESYGYAVREPRPAAVLLPTNTSGGR